MSARHCLELDDLDPQRLARLVERARAWKRDPASVPKALAETGVAALFEKPSARTRASFEMAVYSLGGHLIHLRPEEVGLDERESVEDVARTFASFCGVLGARVFSHTTLERMASVVDVPVVNLLSDRAHPCQALADLLTLDEHLDGLAGRRLAFVGDGNNVVASLAYAAALSGLELAVASPPGYELDADVIDAVRNLGGVVDLVTDPYDAVREADAVYADVFTSMGQEAEAEHRRVVFAPYRVDGQLMAAARPGARFLHCLPAHRGEEVTDEVLDGPASVVWEQAANRMDSVRALLVDLVADGEAG